MLSMNFVSSVFRNLLQTKHIVRQICRITRPYCNFLQTCFSCFNMSDDVLKAGHEPARKIGKQRQCQQRRKSGENNVESKSPSAVGSTEPLGMFNASNPVAMTTNQLPADTAQQVFSEKAVKQMHNKPVPTIQQSRNVDNQHHIQQPRK